MPKKDKEGSVGGSSPTVPYERRAAVYYYNGIGNFIQMVPALQALGFMDGGLVVDLVRDETLSDSRFEAYAELAQTWPWMGEVVNFNSQFKTRPYAYHFANPHSQKPPAWQFGAEKYGHPIWELNWGVERLHEVEYYMHSIRQLGFRGPTPPKLIPVPNLRGPIIDAPADRIQVAFVNGFFMEASMRWDRKAWPHFGPLADLLHGIYNADIHLVGFSEAELIWAERLGADKRFAFNWVGRLNIKEEVKLLSQMDLVVSTDTGLMHVADALEKPYVVALFGGTLVSKNGPWNRHKSAVVRAPVQCVGCQHSMPVWRQCGQEIGSRLTKTWPCMDALSPDMVLKEVRRWWSKRHDDSLGRVRPDGPGHPTGVGSVTQRPNRRSSE